MKYESLQIGFENSRELVAKAFMDEEEGRNKKHFVELADPGQSEFLRLMVKIALDFSALPFA